MLNIPEANPDLDPIETLENDESEAISGAQVEAGEKVAEVMEDPLLTLFKRQLSGKVDEAKFVKAMTPEKLASARVLKDPEIAWVEGNEIVITDGCPEVPEETLGMDYFTARKHCSDNGLQMFTRHEYLKLQIRTKKFEVKTTVTWLESGEHARDALCAYWSQDMGVVYDVRNPELGEPNRGVHRSLRVMLEI